MLHVQGRFLNRVFTRVLTFQPSEQRLTIGKEGDAQPVEGLFIRDIAEVRSGSDAFHFGSRRGSPDLNRLCLTLVGSEKSYSLRLPSKNARDWLLGHLNRLIQEVTPESTYALHELRGGVVGERPLFVAEPHFTIEDAIATFQRGVEVKHQTENGSAMKVLSVDQSGSSLRFASPSNPNDAGNITLPMKDVSQIRLGPSFVSMRAQLENLDKFITIVATEQVIGFETPNMQTRNDLSQQLRILALHAYQK
jgi:hypothetical protein